MLTKPKVIFAISAILLSSASFAQNNYQLCVNGCYQNYLAGMNGCKFVTMYEACQQRVQNEYTWCRMECTETPSALATASPAGRDRDAATID
jgi:hypothetical protein